MNYYLDTEFHEYSKNITKFPRRKAVHVDTIELISIGIFSEDGREYYSICKDFDIKAAWANEWLRENVLRDIWGYLNNKMGTYHKTYHWETTSDFCLKHLKRLIQWRGKSKSQIAEEVVEFTKGKGCAEEKNMNVNTACKSSPPVFFAYYADYDWVVFCWLFGRMIDLPKCFPMYCRDLKQMLDELVWSIKEHGETWEDGLQWIKKHRDYPKQENEHNALDDAKWNKDLHEFILKL